MGNPEQLVHNTQDEDKQNKQHNTISIRHQYTQTHTDSLNKPWPSYKDEPNIVFMWKS